MTRLTDEIAQLKRSTELLEKNQGKQVFIGSELVDFFKKAVEVLEREIFTHEEFYLIWLSLNSAALGSEAHTKLAERVREMSAHRKREGI